MQLTPGCLARVAGTSPRQLRRKGATSPGDAWLPQLSRTPQGDVPAPKFWAAGYLPDLSPPLLQYHTHGTLVSPGEGQSGNKGVFVQRLPGGGSRACSRFPAPLGDGQAPRLRASPSLERRPPRPQRLRSGCGAPGHRGFFPGGRAARRLLAGSAARGGTVGVLGAGGGGGGGRGSLRPAEPGGAGRAPRALSGLLLPEPRRLESAPSLLPSSPFSRAAPSLRRAPLPCRHHAPLLPSWHFPLEPSFWTNFDGEFHTTLEKCRL